MTTIYHHYHLHHYYYLHSLCLRLGLVLVWGALVLSAEVRAQPLNPGESREKKVESTLTDMVKQVRQKLEELKHLEPEKYFQELDSYKSFFKKYIEYKKRICEGDFSTIILGDGQREGFQKIKGEEKKVCFRELKSFQTAYINNMFLARKRYLDYLHQERIKQLKEVKEKALKNLGLNFKPTR